MRLISGLMTLALLLICTSVNAQLRKCVAPDGKITYSDVLCAGGSSTADVKVHSNVLDTSGAREEAARSQAEADMNNTMANPPIECQFKSYNNNDEKGKILADKAKLECVRNIQAEKQGKPTSRDAYTMWKDHYDQTTSKRQAALGRAVATINAANKPMVISPIGSKDLTCKPNAVGTALNCR